MNEQLKTCCLILITTTMLAMPAGALAQARRPDSGMPSNMPKILKKGIDKISYDTTYTPEYDVNTQERKASKKQWAVVTVLYETLPDWTDELEFRFYVVVQGKQDNVPKYTLFPLTVTYSDIPKGKHIATEFLRPNTIARYGAISRAAVEVVFRGGIIARESIPADNQRWWESPALTRIDGALMGRSQTPFAFVSWDNYEAEKIIPGR